MIFPHSWYHKQRWQHNHPCPLGMTDMCPTISQCRVKKCIFSSAIINCGMDSITLFIHLLKGCFFGPSDIHKRYMNVYIILYNDLHAQKGVYLCMRWQPSWEHLCSSLTFAGPRWLSPEEPYPDHWVGCQEQLTWVPSTSGKASVRHVQDRHFKMTDTWIVHSFSSFPDPCQLYSKFDVVSFSLRLGEYWR